MKPSGALLVILIEGPPNTEKCERIVMKLNVEEGFFI